MITQKKNTTKMKMKLLFLSIILTTSLLCCGASSEKNKKFIHKFTNDEVINSDGNNKKLPTPNHKENKHRQKDNDDYVELLTDKSDYDDDNDDDDDNNDMEDSDNLSNNDKSMSSEDQIKLLTKQLGALVNQRREDYKMLEASLKKYVKNNAASFVDEDIRVELEKLR